MAEVAQPSERSSLPIARRSGGAAVLPHQAIIARHPDRPRLLRRAEIAFTRCRPYRKNDQGNHRDVMGWSTTKFVQFCCKQLGLHRRW